MFPFSAGAGSAGTVTVFVVSTTHDFFRRLGSLYFKFQSIAFSLLNRQLLDEYVLARFFLHDANRMRSRGNAFEFRGVGLDENIVEKYVIVGLDAGIHELQGTEADLVFS